MCVALLMGISAWAQTATVSIYDDCNKNGKNEDVRPATEEDARAIDLGLPSGLKWASCNVGAETPEGYGDYYAWGEVAPKEDYSWPTYKHANGDKNKLTKYCNNTSFGNNNFTDDKTILDLEDDAAYVKWGDSWRMPTDAEWTELIEQCTWTWTTQSNINGYKVTSKTNDNSIFLPATGYRAMKNLNSVGTNGRYWSSSLTLNVTSNAWSVQFASNSVNRKGNTRAYAISVRPVYMPIPAKELTLYANDCESANVITCDAGQQVEVTAVPANENRRFVQWSDGNTDNPRTLTLTENITLTANFEAATPTAMEQNADNQVATAKKIVRNGQVLILRDGKIYTVTGIEVKE